MQVQADGSNLRLKPPTPRIPIDKIALRTRSAANELKGRIAALADESRSLRRNITRSLNDAERLRIETKLTDAGYAPLEIRRILARARTADPEKLDKFRAAIMKRVLQIFQPQMHPPEILLSLEASIGALHHYRTAELRPRLRRMSLAYGFLRGKPYAALEKKSYSPPPWHGSRPPTNAISPAFAGFTKLIFDHSIETPQGLNERLDTWISEAGEWKHPATEGAAIGGGYIG